MWPRCPCPRTSRNLEATHQIPCRTQILREHYHPPSPKNQPNETARVPPGLRRPLAGRQGHFHVHQKLLSCPLRSPQFTRFPTRPGSRGHCPRPRIERGPDTGQSINRYERLTDTSAKPSQGAYPWTWKARLGSGLSGTVRHVPTGLRGRMRSSEAGGGAAEPPLPSPRPPRRLLTARPSPPRPGNHGSLCLFQNASETDSQRVPTSESAFPTSDPEARAALRSVADGLLHACASHPFTRGCAWRRLPVWG